MVLVLAPVLLFAGGDWSIGFPVKGNGDMVTFKVPVSSFKNIQVSGSSVVYFHESQDFSAVVTVDSNLREYIRVETRGDVLNIGTKRGRACIYTQYIVDVYCPSLNGVSISGSARFETKEKLKTNSFNLNVSGLGRIEGAFECNDFSSVISGSAVIDSTIISNRLKMNISGTGKITLTGTVKDMDILISGSGDFFGNELCVNNADLRISGSTEMHLWVLDNLKGNSSGSGRVIYRGTPKVEWKSSGSCRLESA